MPDVKMNYESMNRMATAFEKASQQMDATASEMEKVAKSLEEGALVGGAGDTFKEAIRGVLIKRLTDLAEQLFNLRNDIEGALVATRDGVTTAQSRFK